MDTSNAESECYCVVRSPRCYLFKIQRLRGTRVQYVGHGHSKYAEIVFRLETFLISWENLS